jgi:hypothetical protein
MDSDGNGKVTKEEMSATFEKMASQLDGPFPRMRLQEGQGKMPPTPPLGGGQGTQQAGSTDNSSQASDPADTNGDGKVSAQEAMVYTEKQISSDTDTSSTSSADTQLMQMLAGGMPPPQDGGQGDQGFTKDQLVSMSKNLSSTDSTRATVMNDVAANFDTADTNSDGKVNASEARAYEESKSTSSTRNTTDNSLSASTSIDEKVMKQMMQLIHAYGGGWTDR